jgi:hypothetical protein
MESDPGYSPLQQPGAGYGTPGTASGAATYLAQQAPASSYAPQQGQSGGGGSGAAQATKTYNLPDPEKDWSDNLARYPHVSRLPLYEKGKAPKYDQILQQGIPNCYLAATLAAMANTEAGRKRITTMIAPKKGAITTICKKYDLNSVGPEERLKSDRWFTVAFKGKTVDVSDVLYHDDSDRDPNLRYMTTPKGDRALWGAIIEVAYAKLKGGYDKIGAVSGNTLTQFLDEFSPVKWTILDPADDKAKAACKSAGKRAAFVATRETGTKILTRWHGYAVLSMSGTKVKLWDPLQGKAKEIEFKDLVTDVQAVIGSQ